MKTLDCSVETLGLDYNPIGICIHFYKPDYTERKHDIFQYYNTSMSNIKQHI